MSESNYDQSLESAKKDHIVIQALLQRQYQCLIRMPIYGHEHAMSLNHRSEWISADHKIIYVASPLTGRVLEINSSLSFQMSLEMIKDWIIQETMQGLSHD